MLTLEQFKAARATLRGVIRTTSLIHSPALVQGVWESGLSQAGKYAGHRRL